MQCNSLNSYSNSKFCKNLWKKRTNLFYSIISEMTIISLSMHLKKKTNDNCKKPEKLFQQRWNAHIKQQLLIYWFIRYILSRSMTNIEVRDISNVFLYPFHFYLLSHFCLFLKLQFHSQIVGMMNHWVVFLIRPLAKDHRIVVTYYHVYIL